MVNSADESANRYGFHVKARSTLSKPGITQEFVHNQILDRIESLIKKTENAASLKPDFMGTQIGVAVLKECVSRVGGVLKNISCDLVDDVTIRPSNR